MTDNRKIIYLDLNVFSDFRDKLNADNQKTVDLFATLLWLKNNWNVVIPYSDVHIQELCMTGKGKKKLAQEEVERRIQNDISIIKRLTSDESLSKNSQDGLFYINQSSVHQKYQVYKDFSFFMDSLNEFLNPKEYELLDYTRTLFGFGPKVLNNCKDAYHALEKVDEIKLKMPEVFKALTSTQKEKLKELRIKSLKESSILINKMADRLRKFINDMLEQFDFSEDQVQAITSGMEYFNQENEKALKLNDEMIEKDISAEDFVGLSKLALSDTIGDIEQKHGLSLDKNHIENLMLNMWGFESKGLRFGMSSDHFDISHAEFLPVTYAFITNESEKFKKRFSDYSNRIFSPHEFLDIMRKIHNVDVRVNFTESPVDGVRV
jgi:hypothetical protein